MMRADECDDRDKRDNPKRESQRPECAVIGSKYSEELIVRKRESRGPGPSPTCPQPNAFPVHRMGDFVPGLLA
jgi:hypothetical protein